MKDAIINYLNYVFIGTILFVIIGPILWICAKKSLIFKDNEIGRQNYLKLGRGLTIVSFLYIVFYMLFKYVI